MHSRDHNGQPPLFKLQNTLRKILDGRSDANISFSDLCNVLEKLGFARRIKGDHNIFWKDAVEEIINLQPEGSKCKPYQVKQVREIILKYKLSLDDA